MALIVSLLIYLMFAIIVGLEGRDTRGGFIGTFVVSLLLTPLLAYLLLYCFEEAPALAPPRSTAKVPRSSAGEDAAAAVDPQVKTAA